MLQFLLSLSDRQAAEAVRCRIDFKYAMAMELDDPDFHHSVLADFRDRLTEGDRADRLLDLALARLREARGCSVPTHPSASGLALGSTTSRLQLADTSFQLSHLNCGWSPNWSAIVLTVVNRWWRIRSVVGCKRVADGALSISHRGNCSPSPPPSQSTPGPVDRRDTDSETGARVRAVPTALGHCRNS
ncbi:transposase [Streptomyces niveus]|uniref:transposase n=1 Tax=Streptomyces niveus TaxID=193462 RepID=UPI003870B358|nr:transposase [Streptomyces niveus]